MSLGPHGPAGAEPPPSPSPPPPAPPARVDWITNTLRLLGGVVAVNEALFQATLRPGGLLLAALLIAGANGVESFFETLFRPK